MSGPSSCRGRFGASLLRQRLVMVCVGRGRERGGMASMVRCAQSRCHSTGFGQVKNMRPSRNAVSARGTPLESGCHPAPDATPTRPAPLADHPATPPASSSIRPSVPQPPSGPTTSTVYVADHGNARPHFVQSARLPCRCERRDPEGSGGGAKWLGLCGGGSSEPFEGAGLALQREPPCSELVG